MAKPLRPKRGTTAKNDAFVGLASEITVDTDKHSIRVHDGVTAGGYETLMTSGGRMKGAINMGSNTITGDVDAALNLRGGTNVNNGAYASFYGKDSTGAGKFIVASSDGTSSVKLEGKTDGSLSWGGKEVARSVGGKVAGIDGNVPFSIGEAEPYGTYEGVDLNTFIDAGVYSVKGGSADLNYPSGSNGILVVYVSYNPSAGSRFIRQDYYRIGTVNSNDYNVYTRSIDYNPNTGSTYGTWYQVITSKGGTMTGTIKNGTGEAIIEGVDDTKASRISGGSGWQNGGSFVAYGKDHANFPGMCRFKADDGTNETIFNAFPDGTLTWGGKSVVCVETWQSGANWCRKYSDGWIEQGGFVKHGAVNNYTVTFNTAFKDTNYTALVSPAIGAANGTGGDGSDLAVISGIYNGSLPYGKSKTQLRVSTYSRANDGFNWYACGF